MNKPVKVLIAIFIIILGLLLSKDIIAKAVIENGVQFATGLKLRVSGFNVGVFRSRIDITDLKLYNPKGFKDQVMVDIPKIYIDYNLPAILRGKVHLEDIRLNLREFIVVKNAEGVVNLDYLKPVKAQKEEKRGEGKPKAKAPDIQIDNLELKINKVIYKDYTKRDGPAVREFNINLNEKYKNITNTNAVIGIILVKALAQTTIAGVASIDLGGIKSTVSENLSSASKLASDTADKATQKVTEAGKSITETAGKLKDSIRLPFGSSEK